MSKTFDVGIRITADGRVLVTEARSAKEALNQLGETTRKTSGESANLTNQVNRQNAALNQSTGQASANTASLAGMKTGLVAAAAAYVSFSSAMAGGKAIIDTALANERLNNTLKVATGSAEAAAREIQFLRQESDKLGLSYATVSGQYAKLAVAAKGTELEGQKTRDIFLSIAKASTVLGLSTEQTGGALTAIEQIISKSKVSAEELRGQLGERLAGAFQMAARAMDLTTQELDEHLSKGTLLAEKFLPLLQAEIEKTYGAQAQEAAQGLNAKINRLDNAFTDLKTSIGNTGLLDFLSEGIVLATRFTDALSGAKVLSAVDQQKQKIEQLRSQLERSRGINSIIPGVDGFFFNKQGLDRLEQQIDDATADLRKLEQAANDANAALSGAKTVKPGSKPALPDELSKARESSAKAAASSAKQAADAKAREAKQALESSQKIIESLKRETQEVGLNNVQKKMLVAATEAAKAPTKELAAEIMNSAAAWAQATQKQEESLAQQKLLKEAADERARAEKQAAQQVQQQWRNTWSQVEQNAKMAFIQFAAHGKSAAQAVGEAIKFSIIDVLYQMTIRKWIINIGTSLESTFASSMVGSSGGSTLNTLFNGAGLLNAGKTIFDGFFGAMKSGTSSLVGGIGSLGSSLPGTAGAFFSGMGGTGAAAAQGAQGMWRASGLTGANAMGAAAGSAFASMAGPLLIGYFATKGLKSLAGDKRLGGGFGDAMNFVGDIPILGDLIPIIPIINGLFGRGPLKQKETSLTGLIGTQGFESGTFQTRFKAQGGLFRSDKTDFARVDAVTGEVSSDNRKLLDFANQMSGTAKQIIGLINDTTQQTSGSLRKIAKDLGLSTASLDTFQHTINLVSEKGKALTEEQIGKEISNITESLAKSLIPEIDSLAKKGETALQAVGRLGVEFNALVNSAAILLGKTVADSRAFVSGFGFQDRTAFVDQAGGADELLRKTAFFAENFLTNAERLAPKQALLNEELQKLGLSADLTRDEFRKLMQTSGPDMVQSLLNLQFSFVEVRTAQEQLAEATRQKAEADRESAKIAQEAARAQLLSNASGAFSALQKSIDRERERLTNDYNAQLDKVNTRIQDVTQSIGKLKSLSDALKNTINQIQPLNRDQAKQQIKDAINIARRGGDLPDAESLRNALGVLGNNQTIDNASTPFEKAREQAKTAILLGQLGNVTDSRLTLEERSLAALESQKKRLETGFDDQMKRLDTMLEQGQTQIDLLNGINTSIMSMADALSKFNFRLLQAGGQPIALPSGEIPVMRGNPKISDQQIRDFANAPGRTAMEIYNAARENGVSFTQYANATGANLKTLRLWARRHGLPTFADGGLHSGGLRIVGERGPELEFTGPSRITSNNDLNKLLNNDAVVNELRVLVAEIKEVKKSSERTAARLDAVTRGGTALRTKAA